MNVLHRRIVIGGMRAIVCNTYNIKIYRSRCSEPIKKAKYDSQRLVQFRATDPRKKIVTTKNRVLAGGYEPNFNPLFFLR